MFILRLHQVGTVGTVVHGKGLSIFSDIAGLACDMAL